MRWRVYFDGISDNVNDSIVPNGDPMRRSAGARYQGRRVDQNPIVYFAIGARLNIVVVNQNIVLIGGSEDNGKRENTFDGVVLDPKLADAKTARGLFP